MHGVVPSTNENSVLLLYSSYLSFLELSYMSLRYIKCQEYLTHLISQRPVPIKQNVVSLINEVSMLFYLFIAAANHFFS